MFKKMTRKNHHELITRMFNTIVLLRMFSPKETIHKQIPPTNIPKIFWRPNRLSPRPISPKSLWNDATKIKTNPKEIFLGKFFIFVFANKTIQLYIWVIYWYSNKYYSWAVSFRTKSQIHFDLITNNIWVILCTLKNKIVNIFRYPKPIHGC